MADQRTNPTLARVLDVITYIVMIGLAIAFVLPLLWMIGASLKEEGQVLAVPPTLFPSQPQWANYVQVLELIPVFFWNSVKLAFINVFGLLIVASLAGFAFGRLRFPGRDILFLVVLATAMIPGIAYLIPQYLIFRQIGWIDTQFPLWVPRVFTPVFATFLMRQYFKTLPQELEDAARVDGAGTFTVFWRIMLPQTTPALAAISIFTFLDSWNDLFGPLIYINSENLQTLPVALAQFQNEYFTQITLLMAGATIAVLPVILVYIFAQKYFIQGITMTGLKG
ncbi:carbohydrate ABC transporter permease [Actinopolymorpha pittospori]|uniref:Multiple sugar transport system permease protein/sn-glycerol 3-phosphate transport system permease protein n=1 Tax=Actinopolymorpha pittospori TaxID=648752 RepID=A0A927N5M2_9ACTN|nr:carbohydrate ABC transporter permease [Actinopolymorpha pittospori]MBE1613116.1 multiple sugar transport system permease protein/sn-glycerol 3-phosphate transport system permease protein [Actinopolymorpha pittospori]